jgi:hypothetical protein
MKSPVRGNQMGRNGALGINNTGVRNPNDAGDADGFFSALQNFPEISEFSTNGTSFDLSYRVDSTSGNSAYPMRVEFFKADRDEGRDFLAADNYLAGEAQTFKAVTLSVPAGVTLSADDVILATATDGAGNTSEFTFYPSTLAIQTPVKSACTTADALHCDGFDAGALPSLLARVSAIADSGPFAPRGDVVVTDSRGASCTVTLNPTATPLTSEGTCTLVNSGAAGPITLNATLDTLLSAFAAASGGNASASASFVVP